MKLLYSSIIDLFFPKTCTICNNLLIENEKHICIKCLIELPMTSHCTNIDNNETSKLFEGKFPFQKAASYCYFVKGGSMQKVIHDIKYHNNQELAIYFGFLAGIAFKESGLFENIDILLPVPLHPNRLKERGYNQALLIAEGINKATQIPISTDILKRVIYNSSQTKNNKYNRWKNTSDIFDISDSDLLENKSILLIDDVITTGSTIDSCVNTVLKKTQCQISIFSIAIAL